MKLFPIHKYFIYNDTVCSNSEFIISENEGGIYEVLRVLAGVPLFLEEHVDRFYHSAEIAGKKVIFTKEQITDLIGKLINANKTSEGNILLSCKNNLKAFYIPHKYPSGEMYKNGVTCGILKAERTAPNAKVFQTEVRIQSNKLIEEHGYFEVLLVDHLGRITEGSRSNVFFVKKNELITPPGNEVLLGITRQKTIELANQLNIAFKEEDVYYERLIDYDAMAVTGTSPKILPVRKLEGNTFDVNNNIIQNLMDVYDKLILNYISERKKV